MKKIYTLLSLFICFFFLQVAPSFAQDDMLKMLNEVDPNKKSEPVIATFKTTRIINAQSIETVKKRTLDFRVTHRFGAFSDGKHLLYGFDASSDIRIGLEYGITDNLTVGFARNKRNESLQELMKLRILQQTTDNKMPFAMTLYADAAVIASKDIDSSYVKWQHRINYTTQLILSRKFSPSISFQVMPTWVHRNYVHYFDDENDLFSLGFGGRFKFTRRMAIIFDYFQTFSKFRNHTADYAYAAGLNYYPPLGIGWEIETGGHVFSIMLTNSAGIIESDFITNTTDNWLKKGIRFSFNISRNFRL